MQLENKKNYITGIWLGKFDNENLLREFVEFDYLEDEDKPKSRFAQEIGIYHFDSDFIESIFYPNYLELNNNTLTISFSENFSEELTKKLSLVDYSSKNCIISLTGIVDKNGSVNEQLFDFTPVENSTDILQFIGLFKYELKE